MKQPKQQGTIYHCDCGHWFEASVSTGETECKNCHTTMKKMVWSIENKPNRRLAPE